MFRVVYYLVPALFALLLYGWEETHRQERHPRSRGRIGIKDIAQDI